MPGLKTAFVLLLALVFVQEAGAAPKDRIALVFGNSAYTHVPALPNPTNDAIDIAQALSNIDFAVRPVTDASYEVMRRELLDFNRSAAQADIAVVFFAGHGIEIGGKNYLVPTDAQLLADTGTDREAISLESIIEDVSQARKLGLIILDACRDNPFVKNMRRSAATRSISRGFAAIEPSGNVLVAYAAKHGTTALDGSGDGRNSPFTAALKHYLSGDALEVQRLFRKVRDDVMKATAKHQQPYTYGSLPGEDIFLKPPRNDAAAGDEDRVIWKNLREAFDAALQDPNFKNQPQFVLSAERKAIETFIQKFPSSTHLPEATERQQELDALAASMPVPSAAAGSDALMWQTAQKAAAVIKFNSVFSDFCPVNRYRAELLVMEEFAASFPDSEFVDQAQSRIDELYVLIREQSSASPCLGAAPSDEAVWQTLVEISSSPRIEEIFAACPRCRIMAEIHALSEFRSRFRRSQYSKLAEGREKQLLAMLSDAPAASAGRAFKPGGSKKEAYDTERLVTAGEGRSFRERTGRNLWGGDLGQPPSLRDATVEQCRSACGEEASCRYYSYSLWSRACYLKDRQPAERVDSRYVSGAAADSAPPTQTDSHISMQAFSKRSFKSAPKLRSIGRIDWETCKTRCQRESTCQAVEYSKSSRECVLLTQASETQPADSIVAVKIQE